MKAKFAIIGCGRVSWNHLDALKKAPNAQLVAVCDIDEQKAKTAAFENGLSKWYTDLDEMIVAEKPDVCCVLTPSGMHAEVAIRVANHGVNVLCEKPMEISREKMDSIIDACRENGVKLGCIFQRRTFDAAIAVREEIKKGSFGKLTIGSANLRYYRDQEYYDSGEWRGTWELDGGGALMNQGVHGVDMLSWMMGGVESVYAKCDKLCWDIDVEDTAVVVVKFKNGAVGTIECCTTAYPGLDTIFHVSGSEGNVIFGDSGIYQWQFKDESLIQPETSGNMGGINCQYKGGNIGHILQIEDMANAVLEDRDPMITGEDARASVNIILAIYESAKTGKEIYLN